MSHTVVIGAGQAGFSLVAKLRALGHEGKITLIGEETAPPYQRPPLSKAYLLGDMARDRLFFRPESFYADNAIDLRLGEAVTSIDPTTKTINLAGGLLVYDQLALTTGSTPRLLPAAIGGTLEGVHSVRSLPDIDAIEPSVQEGARVLIIGGGYIGLEAAAVCAKRGMKVVLVEMAERILQRVAAPETSDVIRGLHVSHGVDIREGVGLDHLVGDTHVAGAVLTDGTTLELDLAIVGVGIAPATGVAEAAGLNLDNGIKTDAEGRTSDPSIWAAGDCASFPYKGTRIRLESVQNAIDQAECVAENIMGAGKSYIPSPWFWSDQYDAKLQIAGLNTGYDDVVVRPGANGAVSHWYYQGETLLAVDAINDPRAYMVGKRLLDMGKSPSKTDIVNPETELKALLKP